MLNKDLIKVLSKIYKHQNSEYDFEKEVKKYKIPDSLTERQKEILAKSKFELNNIKDYSHNDVIPRLKKISENSALEAVVSNLFIKAVGSGFNRGVQPIFSYYFSKNMPQHSFQQFVKEEYQTEGICKVCGINETICQNDNENLYDLYIGYCRLGGYTEILLDLEEILKFNEPKATGKEKESFLNVIDIIEKASKDETPSALIKRLSKEKCLPGSSATSRTWIVKCLAELGILRNKYDLSYSIMNSFITYEQKFEWELDIHKNSPARADVEFPISGWRGELGLNKEIVDRIISNANKL